MHHGLYQYICERDGAACRYCGATEGLELDHVIPRGAALSTERASNRVLACGSCNRRKGRELGFYTKNAGRELYFYGVPVQEGQLFGEALMLLVEAMRLERQAGRGIPWAVKKYTADYRAAIALVATQVLSRLEVEEVPDFLKNSGEPVAGAMMLP